MTSATTARMRAEIADIVRGHLAAEMNVDPASIADDEEIFASGTLADLVTLVLPYVRAKD